MVWPTCAGEGFGGERRHWRARQTRVRSYHGVADVRQRGFGGERRHWRARQTRVRSYHGVADVRRRGVRWRAAALACSPDESEELSWCGRRAPAKVRWRAAALACPPDESEELSWCGRRAPARGSVESGGTGVLARRE